MSKTDETGAPTTSEALTVDFNNKSVASRVPLDLAALRTLASEGASLASALPLEHWYAATDGHTNGHLVFAEEVVNDGSRRTLGTVVVIPWDKRQLPSAAQNIANFIATARTSVPALASAVEQLCAALEAVRRGHAPSLSRWLQASVTGGPSEPITLNPNDAQNLAAIAVNVHHGRSRSAPTTTEAERDLQHRLERAADRWDPVELSAEDRKIATNIIRENTANDERGQLLRRLDPPESRQHDCYTPSTEVLRRSVAARALVHTGASAQYAADTFEEENARLIAEITRDRALNGQPSIWLSPPVSPEAVTWAAVSPEVREVVDSALASYVVLTTGLPSERFVGPAVSAARALLKSVPFNGPAAEPAKEEP